MNTPIKEERRCQKCNGTGWYQYSTTGTPHSKPCEFCCKHEGKPWRSNDKFYCAAGCGIETPSYPHEKYAHHKDCSRADYGSEKRCDCWKYEVGEEGWHEISCPNHPYPREILKGRSSQMRTPATENLLKIVPQECCPKCWHIPQGDDHKNGIYNGYCFNPDCPCHTKPEQPKATECECWRYELGDEWHGAWCVNRPKATGECVRTDESHDIKDCRPATGEGQVTGQVAPTHSKDWDIEVLSATLHAIYQNEAHRQEKLGLGPARHYDEYEKLSEDVKEFDRVLARYIISLLETEREKAIEMFADRIKQRAMKEMRFEIEDQKQVARTEGAAEERQFILNVLDGIDAADEEMGNIGGGTKAIRFALASRPIETRFTANSSEHQDDTGDKGDTKSLLSKIEKDL